MRLKPLAVALCLALPAPLLALPAGAQSPAKLPTAGAMAGGYSGARASTGAPTDFSLRDASGNLIIVNGQPQTGSGYEPGYGGGGGFGQTAIALGNQLTVQASGSWNVIIVDAVQTNSGDITAHAGAASARAGQTR